MQLAANQAVADEITLHQQQPAVDLFQVVDAAQKCALSRAGGSDDAGNRSFCHLQVHALEHLESAERFADALGVNSDVLRNAEFGSV
ncbi:hypothetical protein D9M68_938930 [compost metagenome]